MTPRPIACRFDDRVAGRAIELTGPREVLVASRDEDVRPVLDAVERAAQEGRFAGGFVAYEAAPGLDPGLAVRVRTAGDAFDGLPLAWFGIFDGAREVDALAVDPASPPVVADWRWALDERRHAEKVAAIHERIAAGWTYQANLTTHLGATAPIDPAALYARIGAAQGGAYHAYLDTGEWTVACASPELFFGRDGALVVTRPMKGTTARGHGPVDDDARRAAMLASPKERAENVMIVDLVRNDLGRLAEPGSVAVPELFVPERYPGVWQLTSTVTARMPASVGLADLFAALFPCGSVTGAPKPATMALLATLEDRPRGVYCGAVGYVAPGSPRARARFAVAIRTVTTSRRSGRSEFGVGSGVTWDSDPCGEWAEMATKAGILPSPRSG